MAINNPIGGIPPDKIADTFVWRDWFKTVGSYLQAQQQVLSLPSYATTAAPPAVAGAMYFDTTLGKFRACEVTGTWKTVTTV